EGAGGLGDLRRREKKEVEREMGIGSGGFGVMVAAGLRCDGVCCRKARGPRDLREKEKGVGRGDGSWVGW
ncbi:unnamed protein product, partial [Ilex paraguariensis]